MGFLFADGAITQYNHSYDIELSLKIDDKEHVEKFAKALNKEYVNNNSTYRSRCILGSKHMFNVLTSYGKLGYAFSKYLYENSTIYLKRKYERYNKYCLVYQR